MSEIIIATERHWRAALNKGASLAKKQDRLIKQLLEREELIKEQIKMQNHPYTRMKATVSMLRKMERVEQKILRTNKSMVDAKDAKWVLEATLKELGLRPIDIPEDYDKEKTK